jgi:prepilin-type N-terminal cleavage/methylation domain-containing protein
MKQKKSLQKKQKGFTLIELLIVITIIGILATWAVAIYTSQIQKARDTTRISDISALKAAVEQVYQDLTLYPASQDFGFNISPYMGTFPADSKHANWCGGSGSTTTDCAYAYISGEDDNHMELWAYELSTAFESSSNRDNKGKKDSGNDLLRWETGITIDTLITAVAGSWVTLTKWICTLGGAEPSLWDLIVIYGNPTGTVTSGNQCQ